MISFSQYLLEFMDSPLKWEWKKRTPLEYVAQFMVPDSDQRIVVEFHLYKSDKLISLGFTDESAWSVDSDKNMYALTGKGNAVQIFATIVDIIKTYLKLIWSSPEWNQFQFTADLRIPSRVRLYDRFADMLKRSGAWKQAKDVEAWGEKIYTFYK